MAKWSEDQCIVLVALFFLSEFKEGDDSHDFNLKISKYFKRSRASVDMQWRNIKSVLNDERNRFIAANIRHWVAFGINDLPKLKSMAGSICIKNNWRFKRIIDYQDSVEN
jgi:hypothetical protein